MMKREGAQMALQFAIDDWVQRLTAIPENEFKIPGVLEFVTNHGIEAASLEPYVYYAKSHYTRNLIYKCELFEVLAICWEPGQVSRIHNHRGQNCWMVTPIGKLRVQNFRVEGRNAAQGTCRLIPTDAYDMDAQHPVVVDPKEPVHTVANLPEFGAKATSVHIYSHPYAECEVYSLDKGTYMEVPLHYSSEYGRLSPDETLA
jgi:cysteine dioxygenase